MNQHIRLCAFILPFLILPGVANSQSAGVSTALTLRHAVERAVSGSFELSRQDALLGASQAERMQAGLLANPNTVFSFEQLRQQGNAFSEWTLAVDYPLLTILTRSQRIDAADFALHAATHRRTRHLDALAHKVRFSFLRVWETREIRRSLREMQSELRSLGRNASLRSGEGDISSYEEQRLQGELSRLQWRVTQADESVNEAEADLALLLAIPLDTLVQRDLLLPVVTPASLDIASLQTSGLAQREDLKSLRAEHTGLLKRSDWLGMRWMDELRIGGGYKRQSDDYRGPIMTVSLPLAVFDRGQGSALVATKDAALVGVAIRELEHSISLEVQRGIASLHRLQEEAAALRLHNEADAAKMVSTAAAAYREGEFSLVEFLDAIRAHIDNTELRSAVRASLLRAAFNLEHAVGGSIFTFQETN